MADKLIEKFADAIKKRAAEAGVDENNIDVEMRTRLFWVVLLESGLAFD